MTAVLTIAFRLDSFVLVVGINVSQTDSAINECHKYLKVNYKV